MEDVVYRKRLVICDRLVNRDADVVTQSHLIYVNRVVCLVQRKKDLRSGAPGPSIYRGDP